VALVLATKARSSVGIMIAQACHPPLQTTSHPSGHRHALPETCRSGTALSQMPVALTGTSALLAMISSTRSRQTEPALLDGQFPAGWNRAMRARFRQSN